MLEASLQLWIDADACPAQIKNIICKAADKRLVRTVFFANHHIALPKSAHIVFQLVARGFDVADREILALVNSGDLVVTQDIPLASEVIERGAVAINPRGTLYTPDNMHGHLVRRNRAEEMRALGVQSGGPEPFGPKHAQAFAQAFDKLLTHQLAKFPSKL